MINNTQFKIDDLVRVWGTGTFPFTGRVTRVNPNDPEHIEVDGFWCYAGDVALVLGTEQKPVEVKPGLYEKDSNMVKDTQFRIGDSVIAFGKTNSAYKGIVTNAPLCFPEYVEVNGKWFRMSDVELVPLPVQAPVTANSLTANRFWLVWKNGGLSAIRKHATYLEAEQEAERLASQNSSSRFYVLESVSFKERPISAVATGTIVDTETTLGVNPCLTDL